MDQEREQWQRARSLYTEVLGLGVRSPHRADALFYLGWTEYRLGNRSEARSHFEAFVEGFAADARRAEAESMSIVCRSEEMLAQAKSLAGVADFSAMQIANEKFQDLVHFIDANHVRVQNKAYRSIIQNIAIDAGMEAIDYLESHGRFDRSDSVYKGLRRIIGFSSPETTLRDNIASIIHRHLNTPAENPSAARHRERARDLLNRISQDFLASVP